MLEGGNFVQGSSCGQTGGTAQTFHGKAEEKHEKYQLEIGGLMAGI
jgi:hypothetical protein